MQYKDLKVGDKFKFKTHDSSFHLVEGNTYLKVHPIEHVDENGKALTLQYICVDGRDIGDSVSYYNDSNIAEDHKPKYDEVELV